MTIKNLNDMEFNGIMLIVRTCNTLSALEPPVEYISISRMGYVRKRQPQTLPCPQVSLLMDNKHIECYPAKIFQQDSTSY